MTAASVTTILIMVVGTAALLALFDGVNTRINRRIQMRRGQQPGPAAQPQPFASRFLLRLLFVSALSAVVLLSIHLIRPE